MDVNLLRAVSCWLLVLHSVCIPAADTRLVHSGRSGASSPQSSMAHGAVQPRPTAAKQQESAEPEVRPRLIEVKCHPDSMEVVVQADMFDVGLQVEGGHLQLGAGPPGGCGAVQSGAEEFTLQARLTDCGTKLSVNHHSHALVAEADMSWLINFGFVFSYSRQRTKSSTPMCCSTHLSPETGCSDWMKQPFLLNVTMKGKFS